MKRFSLLFIAAAICMLASCSDDEKKPKKGTLTIDGENYSMFKLFGYATLGSGHSHYEYIIANDKAKVVDDEPSGSGINFVSISFTREEEVSAVPITGTFVYNPALELYDIDNLLIGIDFDSDSEDAEFYLEDFDTISVTISKSGSTYTIAGVAVIDGIDVTFSYKGKLTALPDENEELSKSAGNHAVQRWM